MSYLIIGCFIVAAVLGMVLLTYVLTNKETPKAIAILHGTFAAIGLVSLIIFAMQEMNNIYWGLAGLFIVVASVGFYMFSRDLTGKGVPKNVAVIHALVAVLLVSSLLFMFSRA